MVRFSSISWTVLLFLLFVFVTLCHGDESMCTSPKHHPAFSDEISPVLIRCWTFMTSPRLPRTTYLAKYDKHMYAPASDPTSLMFDRLDWFWTASGHGKTNDFVMLHMNRNSRVYLAVPVHKNSVLVDAKVSLGDGWKPIGEAILTKGVDVPFDYGVYQKYEPNPKLNDRIYIFQKRGRDVALPHFSWIGANIKGFEIPNGKSIITMITEGDGTKWEYPPNPVNVREPIMPNAKCPEELHDMWVTPNTDPEDEDTKGMMWATWHPLWDPIYWCSYGHEHGASSIDLMGYWPKYGYTAWKNKREDESNEGFKNLIVESSSGRYMVLYMVHMQTSKLRRVYERYHTITLAVVEKHTKRLVAEVTHKGDFGALTARLRNNRFMPIDTTDAELMEEFKKQPRRRSINILRDDGVRDERLQYRNPAYNMMMGTYEDWTTVPVCSAGGRSGNLRADVTRSATGIPGFDRKDEMVYLGKTDNGMFFRQSGQARILIGNKYKFGSEFCKHLWEEKPEIEMRGDGVFYTNANGTSLKKMAGRYAIRQYVEPGLHLEIHGEFRATNSFTGLLELGSRREMEDLGYGINPDIN